MKRILSFLLVPMLLMPAALPVRADDSGAEAISETAAPDPVPTNPPVTEPPAPPQATEPPAPTQCPHSWDAGTGTDATCEAAGTKSYTCTLCGGTRTETIPALGHSYGAWTATVEGHSRTCATCGKATSGAHAFTENVTQQPTCKEEGIIADYCATCEYIVYEVLPRLTTHTYDNSCDPDCNVCGTVREVEHDYQAWWTKGASGHWHQCAKCGDKGDFGKHYPGPAATEQEAQLCLTCGYTLTPRLNHQHEWAQVWTADEQGHWYGCTGCEDQKDFKDHAYDDPCDSECNVCGYQNGNAHTFDGTWHSDEDGHWFVCTTCSGVAEAKEHVAPASVASGEAVCCVECGYRMAQAQTHTHDFGSSWKSDEGNHWQECACGEQSTPVPHTWDEGLEGEGVLVRSCTQCGARQTQEISAPAEGEFPWGMVLVILLVLLAAAVAALIFVLNSRKKGKRSR